MPKQKNMLNLNYFIRCLLVACLFLSCNKSDSYDVKGDVKVKFYTNNESLGNAPQNSISYNVVNIPDVASSGLLNLSNTVPAAIKFPVLATRPVSGDVVIGAALDNSLVAAYNAAHNTSYAVFPDGVLSANALAAQILKGETSSADSINITPDLAKLNLLTGTAYMAPVKLTTVSNGTVGEITSSESSQIAYIIMNVELRRIKYLATALEAQGSLQTPRTAWTVLFTPTPTTSGSILDGSTTTFSRWGTSPGQVDVNMQTSRNVTGIRLYTSNSATQTPTQIEVYLSEDGINYDLIGSPLRANLTYASSYNYILFYKAIPAKYVRLKLYYTTSTNTQNTRITELDVYGN